MLGLRLVKKTVNQDDPTVYHLFYADEAGSAGADITFFEYPARAPWPGRAGHGAPGRLARRLRGGARLLGAAARRRGRRDRAAPARASRFADPEGLDLELAVVETTGRAARREASRTSPPSSPCRASTACAPTPPIPSRAARFSSEALGFEPRAAGSYEVRGEQRGSFYLYDPPPAEPGVGGAGTVHHVAWASPRTSTRRGSSASPSRGAPDADHRPLLLQSIYFREPSGVLFEIATIGPGFATDEPLEHLGERLSLPPDFEHLRAQVEPLLTQLPNPRG